MSVTMKDIAAQLGVSQSLVSFVIGNNEKQLKQISKETQERVLRCAKELGYQRNELAASIKRGKSLEVGLLVSNMRFEFHARVIEGILTSAEEKGYSIKLIKLCEEEDVEASANLILKYHLCGLIFLGISY